MAITPAKARLEEPKSLPRRGFQQSVLRHSTSHPPGNGTQRGNPCANLRLASNLPANPLLTATSMSADPIPSTENSQDSTQGNAPWNPYRLEIFSGANPLWVCERHRCDRGSSCDRHPAWHVPPGDLARLATDSDAMRKIRSLVYQAEHGHGVHRACDHKIIERFCWLLEFGRWRICSIRCVSTPPAPATRGSSPPPPQQQRPAPTSRSSASAPVASEPEATTFPANHEAAAQAAVLIAAAESGAPFCEECEKLRRQNSPAGQP